MTSLVLIGFMGAGKTTISKKLAARLDQSVIDMDDYLVQQLGCSIEQYFATFGEAAFRDHETALLKTILQKKAVIATGGGVVLQKENQELLKQQQVIYLKGEADILIERIRQDQTNIRPLALKNSDTKLREIMWEREKIYKSLAKITIDTSKKSPDEIITEIIKWVENNDENWVSRS
ncbi:TPA: shikimate kinase [Enterococcus hirae]